MWAVESVPAASALFLSNMNMLINYEFHTHALELVTADFQTSIAGIIALT